MNKIVVALGGNALQPKGEAPTAETQLRLAEISAGYIADMASSGNVQLVISHGNGPQVGAIALRSEFAASVAPVMPLDVCSAMSQGYIGYHLQQALNKKFCERGIDKKAFTVVTQVLVDENDPAFEDPTKPIGAFYTKEEAEKISKETGYVFKEDAGRGWRRVVPSPLPKEIIELDAAKLMLDAGYVPIVSGGGGIPVVREKDGSLRGIAAVIDKDYASEKLAEALDADMLFILTAIDRVCVNFGRPDQRELSELSVSDAEKYIAEGQFAPGSMLPKVAAAVSFAKSKPGRLAVIASLEKAADALQGSAGTKIFE